MKRPIGVRAPPTITAVRAGSVLFVISSIVRSRYPSENRLQIRLNIAEKAIPDERGDGGGGGGTEPVSEGGGGCVGGGGPWAVSAGGAVRWWSALANGL